MYFSSPIIADKRALIHNNSGNQARYVKNSKWQRVGSIKVKIGDIHV